MQSHPRLGPQALVKAPGKTEVQCSEPRRTYRLRKRNFRTREVLGVRSNDGGRGDRHQQPAGVVIL